MEAEKRESRHVFKFNFKMKNNNLIGYAVVLCAAVFVLASCSKDENLEKVKGVTKSGDPTTVQVQDFLEEVNNENVADRDKSEALFIMEAALNYHYKKPMSYSVFSSGQYTELALVIENGVVSGSSLADDYQRIITFANENANAGEFVNFIDISSALDSNNVEQLRAVVAYGTTISPTYFQAVGDWKAGANGGQCVNPVYGTGDAAVKIGQVYDYHYAHNFIRSAVDHTKDVYYTNIEVSGTGGSGIGVYNYPAIIPDLHLPYSPGQSGLSLTIAEFALPGSHLDTQGNTNIGINDCVYQNEINIYATNVENKIYTISPSTGLGQEPFSIWMGSSWWFAQGNTPCNHNFYASFFGVPHIL